MSRGAATSGFRPRGPALPTRVTLAALLVVVLWASAFPAVTIALEGFTPGGLALARYAVASLLFLGVAALRPPARPLPAELARLAVCGGCGIALYNVALNTGQQTVSPGATSLVVNTVPMWTSLLAVPLLGERAVARQWWGSALALTGVALLTFERVGVTVGSGAVMGVAWVMAAAVAQALYFVVAKPLLRTRSAVEVTAWAVWLGTLFLLPWTGELTASASAAGRRAWLAVLFLGFGPAALAYAAWSFVLANSPAGKAALWLFLVPAVAVGLSWMVFGAPPTPMLLVGGAFCVGGVAVGRR
ncbi:MAG: DMT family transporter [Acidobacteriota bacterium]